MGPSLFDSWAETKEHTQTMQNFDLFEVDEEDSPALFVSMDRSWVHHYHPENKEWPKQWKHASSQTPKEAKEVSSAGKAMTSLLGIHRVSC